MIRAKGMTVTPSGQLSPNWKCLPRDQLVGLARAHETVVGEILNLARDRRGIISPFIQAWSP